MRERAAGLGLAGCLLAAAAAAAGPATPVGPEEFQRDLVGKVWRVELPDGQTATERVNADGTATITGGLEDTGRWRLSEDGFCTRWTRMREGGERCFTLDRTADGLYRAYKPNGEVAITILEVREP